MGFWFKLNLTLAWVIMRSTAWRQIKIPFYQQHIQSFSPNKVEDPSYFKWLQNIQHNKVTLLFEILKVIFLRSINKDPTWEEIWSFNVLMCSFVHVRCPRDKEIRAQYILCVIFFFNVSMLAMIIIAFSGIIENYWFKKAQWNMK